MADYTPVFTGDSLPFTSTASATITGGRVLAVTAPHRRPRRAASGASVGVAAHDAANGAQITVAPCRAWSTRPRPRPVSPRATPSASAAAARSTRHAATLAAAGR